MVKLRNKIAYILIFFFFSPYFAFSQGKINAPAKECLGNVTSFSYTPPSGLTLSSANWNFGDGFTSGNNTPVHTYGNKGKYTIIIQATFTNSNTLTDSVKIEVFGLPKPAFYADAKNDTCLTRNKICYTDTSRPALPGQNITNRLLVWGDGSFTQTSSPPFGQKLCHNYGVPDKYTVRMELTDIHGCKNSVTDIVEIAENIQPLFKHKDFWKQGVIDPKNKFEFVNCNTVEICLTNLSDPFNPKTAHYEWHLDTFPVDTARYTKSLYKCFHIQRTKTVIARLIAYGNSQCRDTFSMSFNVVIDPLPTKLEILDTVTCFGSGGLDEAWFKPTHLDTTNWYFDNAYDGLKSGPHIYFGTRVIPGIHEVKAEILRGSCTTAISRKFMVQGPFANMRIIDAEQCFSNREVYFIDESKGVKRSNCVFLWNIHDSLGAPCTSNRLKDINKNLNCNYSVDWYTRHKFPNIKKVYTVTLFVMDTVSGCSDITQPFRVDMDYCSVLLDKDSVIICQDKYFMEDIPPPFPIEFTIDSAKQIWRQFPGLMDSSFIGNYDVGLRFKTVVSPWAEKLGDDSVWVHADSMTYYDTVYLKDYLHVKEKKKDSVYVKVYGKCKPFRLSVHFKNGLFHRGERLNIVWGIGGTTNFDSIFTSTVKVDSIFTLANWSGFQAEIRVELENEHGCTSLFRLPAEAGKFLSKDHPKLNCIDNYACFAPFIFEFGGKGFWNGNTARNRVAWLFDDTTGPVEKYNPCYKFKIGGTRKFKMVMYDSFGCTDTLSDEIFIQDPKANIKHTARFVYCSELKQFFDSSQIILHKDDSIKKYLWQFGSGVFSSLQKNPLQSLNTSLDKIPAAHAIETEIGCFDTIFFEIDVIGPKPYFTIKDTVGCGSLNAVFTNLSKNCKQYTWQYGDSAQTTFQTFTKQQVNFLYNKPGRYYISLVGIDTVFNPFTNSMQSCFSTFPDKLFQKDTTRSVLVLPFNKTGISSNDTVCLGSPVTFISKSDTAYDFDYWYMGDTAVPLKLNAGSSHAYQYKKTGLYNVRLVPTYNMAINNFCRDSAQKNILVLGVKADFDIDPANVAPIFLFHNKSAPANASLRWDFGHPGSGASNSSTSQDPSHHYDRDTGTFTVCLIADLPEGCSDTVCKTIYNDYKEGFKIFNVFTPGLIDGKNDQYDILIENEDLYDLQIYNRWGLMVYQGVEDADNTQNINWNGKVFNKGPDCAGGTYYYIFRYSLKQKPGEIITLSGVITLIR